MITRDPEELPTEAYRPVPLHEFQKADEMFAEVDALRAQINQIYLRNNTTTSYRAPKEEQLLFVNHEPRRLTSTQGVRGSVRWIETENRHDIQFVHDGNQLTSDLEDLEMKSPHTLCLQCRSLLREFCENRDAPRDRLLHGANVVLWHDCIASLVISAQEHDCYTCRIILFTYLWERFPSLLRTSSGLAEFHLEVCWDDRGGTNGLRNFYFAAINSSKRKHTSQNYFFLGAMCAWPWDVASGPQADYEQILEPSDGLDQEHETLKRLAHYWVGRCTLNSGDRHSVCAIGDDDMFLPTRFLDVEASLQSDRLRLICQDSSRDSRIEDTKYCTLSHCWGKSGSKQIPLLRQDNLNYRCEKGIPLEELPPAFREAVTVCKWFQVKYLWIDSLCIVQDSKEDWQKEANLMSKIYKSAWLNISADAGEDSQTGLFQHLEPPDRTWPRFRMQDMDHDWTLTPSQDYFIMRIHEAASFSRAWIHRERQLSRRILHFTKYGMEWECCELGRPSYATESLPHGVPFEHFFTAENKYQVGRLEQALVPGDEETYARWNDICEVLSTKRLTEESDRWLILSTIAEDFSQLLSNDKYMAGLWGSTLPHALLWFHERPRAMRALSWAEAGPSWSWLSARHPVTLANRARVEYHAVVADILLTAATVAPPETPSAPVDLFGRPEEQTWELYVLEENLEKELPTSMTSDSITKGMRRMSQSSKRNRTTAASKETSQAQEMGSWRYIGRSWNPTEGDLCDINPDEAKIPVPYDCYVLFVTLDQFLSTGGFGMNTRQLECLILEKVPNSSNTFVRYGRILFHDELAVKLRYKVLSQERFKSFDNDSRHRNTTPQQHIAQAQLKHARNRKDDSDVKKAKSQGADSLYQFDGDVQHAFPWLSRLDTTVLTLV